MVDPNDVPRILSDAARLVQKGELVVFGSASLALWLDSPPRSQDVDLWCEPPDRGDLVEALMGELSWYHDRHDAFVQVLEPATFTAPSDWRDRCRTLAFDELPDVAVRAPHPWDVALAKLERLDPKDKDHIRLILAQFPLSSVRLDALVGLTPYQTGAIEKPERRARFEHGLAWLRSQIA